MSAAKEIGRRMKENYESVSDYRLVRRMPVVVRIDGKAFHTFTRRFDRPFDRYMQKCMAETMLFLCRSTHGCVFGYLQSDEISLCLVDYKKFNSQPYLDDRVQKIASITASMATMAFNREFELRLANMCSENHHEYTKVSLKAMFDSRCFNVPREEVVNYFYWRQLDAIRNSVNSLGQKHLRHKALQNKSGREITEMLLSQKGVDWNGCDHVFKYGTACVKGDAGWIIDENVPLFKDSGREYIERLLAPDEE